MRHVLAIVLVSVAPMAAGYRMVGGSALGRFGVGGLLGIATAALGAVIGAAAGAPVVGGCAALVALVVAGMRRPLVRLPDTPREPMVEAVVLLVGAALVLLAMFRPVPEGDGWAIWSLKSRSIVATGNFDGPVFRTPSYVFSHPDYPPLLPSWQAFASTVADDTDDTRVYQVQLAVLWLTAAAALAALASRGGRLGSSMMAAWLFAPIMMTTILSGSADAPVSLLVVAGAALLLTPGGGVGAVGVVLLVAGALTKNEGAIFAAGVAVGCLVFGPFRRRGTTALVATAVVATTWAVFVRERGASNDAVSAGSLDELGVSELAGRLPQILSTLALRVLDFRVWGIAVIVAGASLIVLRPRSRAFVTAVAIAVSALVARYAVSPYDLTWDLRYSPDRTLMAPIGFLVVAGVLSLATDRPLPARQPSPRTDRPRAQRANRAPDRPGGAAEHGAAVLPRER